MFFAVIIKESRLCGNKCYDGLTLTKWSLTKEMER